MSKHRFLGRDFFEQPTIEVAKALLGKEFIFHHHRGIITETEAYIGQDDPACHAARGKTKRTEVMFGKAGVSYVYLIYGMYHCLNFVTEKEDFPAAVLIRGVKMLGESDILLDGPGKLCRHMGITKEHNAVDMIENPAFAVLDTGKQLPFMATPRIGISQGKDLLWRFLAC